MVQTPKTIRVEPGSELDRVLAEADETPIELESHGRRYRVIRLRQPVEPDDIWAGYDAPLALAALQMAIGGWRGLVDTEEFKTYIAERRRTANRSSVTL